MIPPLVALESGKLREKAREQWPALLKLPDLQALLGRLAHLREPGMDEALSPELTGKLYGATLKSSVSRLEEFAQCPFKFFVKSGLKAAISATRFLMSAVCPI